MRYIESAWTDPAMNLALEQYVFDTLARDDDFFMLWQNRDAVIVGLHQNTAEEVNVTYAEENGISIIRRLSGGGAVFHDLGNLNFTFITNAENAEVIDGGRFSRLIADALNKLGVKAELSGRNDITLGGCKFSGTASYLRDGRLMHHGTLLFDADLDKMSNALRVSNDKFASKGIASVRERVTNLCNHLPPDMTIERFRDYLRRIVAGNIPKCELTDQDIAAIDAIRCERYATWDWNIGRSPGYSIFKRRSVPEFGVIRINMEVTDEKIAAFNTNGDYLGDKPCCDVAAALIGVRFERNAIYKALSKLTLEEYYRGLGIDELVRLILE